MIAFPCGWLCGVDLPCGLPLLFAMRAFNAAMLRREVAFVCYPLLQPILSGDPDLEGKSTREISQENHGARFVWLVDEDDPAGIEISAGDCAGECCHRPGAARW